MAILDSGLKLLNKYAPEGTEMVRPDRVSQEQQNNIQRWMAEHPEPKPIIFIAKVVSYDSAFTLGVFRQRKDAVARCREWLFNTIKDYSPAPPDPDDGGRFSREQVEYYSKVLTVVHQEKYDRNESIDSPIIEEYELE